MRYMFVVAHPDDEILGAGAFIHKKKNEGNEVNVVILNADYEKTRTCMFQDIEKSHTAIGDIKKGLYNFKNMSFYNEPQRDIVETIEEEMRSFEPDFIFTHNEDDIHSDHHITSICTKQASRLWQRHSKGHRVKALYEMEVQSSTDWSDKPFKPDTYVEVSEEDLNAKYDAIAVYNNVVRDRPHPRNKETIFSKAIVRGSEIGFMYAEAFRTVWRGVE